MARCHYGRLTVALGLLVARAAHAMCIEIVRESARASPFV